MRELLLVLFCASFVYGQKNTTESAPELGIPTNLHNGLTERIGNFSIELLFHTSKQQNKGVNLILSPITVWTVLAVISEGASGNTVAQINNALRISSKHRTAVRTGFQTIYEYLQVNTTTVELAKVNAIFMDQRKLLQTDFQSLAESVYKTKVVPLDFTDGVKTADTINQAVSKVTHGRIPKLVDSNYFGDTAMILTSALYFKGQWKVPFNASSTVKMPFYNGTGQQVGEVNMMYNRFTYPFANIKELQARVIELPYGKEDRLSMLIMLPHPGVLLENMFLNFAKVPLDTVFKELRVSKEEYAEDEVDCFLPRFKIESNLDLTNVLRNTMGIVDLFDENAARLPFLARTPMHVSKVIHKAEIEVTEEGTTASGVTAAEFSNRIGIVSFVGNRPFCYLIIEKVTNSIVFGGLYESPSLY
ncbi:serine protease inhibitor 77Ba-like [Pectinophora gossypiella]|uniref:Serpin domain-containing protein n=1 Tax=Pectinophora gossypiella TaxID=13191 RepID=A0A1E1WH84_PECGO|nr:serine protease inhibitor 77Ba-like [Pectinophora gossypiella]